MAFADSKNIKNFYQRSSNWLTLFFIVCLLGFVVLSELFQTPKELNNLKKNFANPLTIEVLTNLKKIGIQNQLGKFELKKYNNKNNVQGWNMISPRIVPADQEVIAKMIRSLGNLSIRKSMPYDKINIEHFALKNPILSLTLVSQAQNDVTIKLGLVNPIDNSMYLYFSNKNLIYQADIWRFPLETLAMSDLIDSRVLSVKMPEILEYTVEKYNGRYYQKALSMKKKGNLWSSIQSGRKLSTQKVEKYLAQVVSVPSQVILDKLNNRDIQKLLERYLGKPAYRVKIKAVGGRTYAYDIGPIIYQSFPEFKIEKKQNILMRAEDRPFPYVVSKEILKVFNVRERKFRR